MTEHWIIYRDVEGFPRKQFERGHAPGPGEMLMKNQTIPGLYGFPTLYIKWHHISVGDVLVHLGTYTEKELSDEEAAALAKEALNREQ